AGVVSESDRAAILVAEAALRADDDVLGTLERRGAPPHAHVLRQAEQIAAWLLPQHVRTQGQLPRGSITSQPACGERARRAKHRVEGGRSEFTVHGHNVAAVGAESPAAAAAASGPRPPLRQARGRRPLTVL